MHVTVVMNIYIFIFVQVQHNGFYRVDYEQKRINEQITVPKHTWKVKANATPMVQMMEKNIKIK